MPKTKLNVLVCDDELPIRMLFSLLLEDAGFQVQVANDGRDALQEMDKEPRRIFDVIVTDSKMPFLDGIGLVKALRKSGYEGKIIVVSGYLDKESNESYEQLEVDRIISKQDGVRNLGEILRGFFLA